MRYRDPKTTKDKSLSKQKYELRFEPLSFGQKAGVLPKKVTQTYYVV
jgi:hypothetical protein